MKKQKKDIYQEITNQIISDIENSNGKFECPWEGGFAIPQNAHSKSHYSGINWLILKSFQMKSGYNSTQWLTYLQAKNLGGQVKKGETSARIVFFRPNVLKDKKTGEEKIVPLLKMYNVFNLEQCKGLDRLLKEERDNLNLEASHSIRKIKKVEKLIKKPKAVVKHDQINRAFYSHSEDQIHLPQKKRFKSTEKYYNTFLHELTHWTGHQSRLQRPISTDKKSYAFEELIAELGASFLSCYCGLSYTTEHANYLKNYVEVLKNDKKAIFRASSQARKAVEFVINSPE